MKIKNKGKVHPSPSSSPSSSSSPTPYSQNGDALSVLKLLPAAILAIASVLSLDDRQVLAYMITRSIQQSTDSLPSSSLVRKPGGKKSGSGSGLGPTHNNPPTSFDCDCFECYTTYWYRWDSSPNRELIHQVIEAFEDHLNIDEKSSTSATPTKKNARKRDKMGRRTHEIPLVLSDSQAPEVPTETRETPVPVETHEAEVIVVTKEEFFLEEVANTQQTEVVLRGVEAAAAVAGSSNNQHKGLARKVLPDVLGLFNSRLWGLLSPNA